MRSPSPSRLMWFVFIGFGLSFTYVALGTIAVYLAQGQGLAQLFFELYASSFNILIMLGAITGTALIVGYFQDLIPNVIESTFTPAELSLTKYYGQKKRYYSVRRTIMFASEFIVIGFIIIGLCKFPVNGLAEALLMVAGCLSWALASYVGRKIRYAGMMIYSLLEVPVDRNFFKARSLDIVNTAVNVVSTMTTIFVYLHIHGYYQGPFEYSSFVGQSAKVFLLLPAVLATPVLLMFNFFPRTVLKKIYDKSIDVEVHSLQELLRGESLGPFEKRLKLFELKKMYREELRYSLQLTLSDLPIGVTILVMIAEPLINR